METTLPAKPTLPEPGLQPAPAVTSLRHAHDKAAGERLVVVGLLGDVAVLGAILSSAYYLRSWLETTGGVPRIAHQGLIEVVCVLGAVLTLLGCFEYYGVYRRERLLNPTDTSARAVRAAGAWLLLCAGMVLLFRLEATVSREFFVAAGAASIAGVVAWRACFHRHLKLGTLAGRLRQRVVLLGWTPEAEALTSKVWKYETDPYEIVGYVNLHGDAWPAGAESATVPYLGDLGEVEKILAAEGADIALLVDLNTDLRVTRSLVDVCERELVQFKMIPSFFPILVSGLQVDMVSGTPLLGVEQLPLNRLGNRVLKRTFDIVGSLVGLALSAPLIAVFGAIVYLESPGPIFYRQRRLGRKGQCFDMIKIRSMKLNAEAGGKPGWTVKDDPRRLKIGALMRRLNIDEVPQFWNVLKGEMSLVGPRPERPELIADFKYDIAHYNARHFIKPGLTGWAQVNGLRGDTSLSERIRYDLHYIEHWSLWLDVRSMVLTFFKRQNAC